MSAHTSTYHGKSDPKAIAAALQDVWREGETQTDLSGETYLELVLTIKELGAGKISAPRIYAALSDEAERKVKDAGGVSKVKSTISMHVDRRADGTSYHVGFQEAVDALREMGMEKSEAAEAVTHLGRVFPEKPSKELIAFFERALFDAASTENTTAQHHHTTAQHRHTTGEPEEPRNTAHWNRHRKTGRQPDGPNDPNLRVSENHPGRAPQAGENRRSAASEEGGSSGETADDSYLRRGKKHLRRGILGAETAIEGLSRAQIEGLLDRTPTDDVPRVPLPDEFCEAVFEWRPAVEESAPLRAIFQLIALSQRRDDSYTRSERYDQHLTGIPLYHELIFAAFGFTAQVGWNEGLSAEKLLDIYRYVVDEGFAYTDWNGEEGRARLVDSHSIPHDLISKLREVKMNPESFDSYTWFLSGNSANSGNHIGLEREERVVAIGEQEPAIEPPEYVRDIQRYMNVLDRVNVFSHGQHGVFKEEALNRASEAAARTIREPERRQQELNKIYWIRRYPKPVYLVCDRFPRLKADPHNQAMNLPSSLLRPIYTPRDYEVDLSKAHLACMVPLAEQEGIDASVLRDWVEWSMEEGNDLWEHAASSFSEEHEWDAEAARGTVKKLYALVYGSTVDNLFFEMSQSYAGPGRSYRSHDAFEPVLDHPLVEEILRIRSELREIIEERGGMEDAAGRFIDLESWDETKAEEDRWRGVMAYVNASYEQKLMYPIFELAREEKARDARARFKVWLYQADGVTVRMSSKASHSRQIERLQSAVAEEADRLGIPTELEVDFTAS